MERQLRKGPRVACCPLTLPTSLLVNSLGVQVGTGWGIVVLNFLSRSKQKGPLRVVLCFAPGGLPEGLHCSSPGSRSLVILAGSKIMELLCPNLTADAGWVSLGAGSLLSCVLRSCLRTLTAEIRSLHATCHGFGTWLSFSQMHMRASTSSLGSRQQPFQILGTTLDTYEQCKLGTREVKWCGAVKESRTASKL